MVKLIHPLILTYLGKTCNYMQVSATWGINCDLHVFILHLLRLESRHWSSVSGRLLGVQCRNLLRSLPYTWNHFLLCLVDQSPWFWEEWVANSILDLDRETGTIYWFFSRDTNIKTSSIGILMVKIDTFYWAVHKKRKRRTYKHTCHTCFWLWSTNEYVHMSPLLFYFSIPDL